MAHQPPFEANAPISKNFPENRAPLEYLIREKEEITYITLTEVIEDIRQR